MPSNLKHTIPKAFGRPHQLKKRRLHTKANCSSYHPNDKGTQTVDTPSIVTKCKLVSPCERFDYRNLKPQPELRYISSRQQLQYWIKLLKGKTIGLDVVYVPRTNEMRISNSLLANKPALLQICDENVVLLIHLNQDFATTLPKAVIQLLCDPEITKVGVGIHNDCINLIRAYAGQFDEQNRVVRRPTSVLEIVDVARVIEPSSWPNSARPCLAVFCKRFLGTELDKNIDNHKGSWNDELTEDQMSYAANDVTSSLHIFLEIQRLAKGMGKTINVKELSQPINTPAICQKILATKKS
ncbi:uncharacterized protein L201_004751 [Kwoniella dendrophila CBS 6074]|uniref:3'-5' exonuclease domain-containing protein n=1 Tax=Kwoniella dendrophila CBS 6074 TaxID=1295534 RepID=A0AAX4JY64_9TREE